MPDHCWLSIPDGLQDVYKRQGGIPMITYAALSPHPPLIIPEIGQRRLQDVQPTVEGMRRLAQELAATAPETVIFLTCLLYTSRPG